MKAKFSLIAAALALGTAIPASAGTVSNGFNVSVNLASKCVATNVSAPTLDFGTYTAFQGSAAVPATPVTMTFDCTRGLAPVSVAFDTTNGNAAGVGVLVGLQYSLTPTALATVAGTAASTATIGTADAVSYSITGSMPASQAGSCGAATCAGSHLRTLIVTY